MRRRTLPLLLAATLTVTACSSAPASDDEGDATPPGRLVLWNTDEIGVLEDGAITDLGATGRVSQVTASPTGALVWTTLDTDPPAVRATIDGETRLELATPTVPFFYQWNPTGTRIAFLGNSATGAGLVFGLIDVENESVTPVESPAPFFFDWSPDGASLIAHVAGTSLGIVDATTGDVEDLGRESGLFPAPIWTDAGIVVATSVGPTVAPGIMTVGLQQSTSSVVLVDPADKTRVELTSTEGPVRLFPSRDRLAVVAGTSGAQSIEVVDWTGALVDTFGQGTIDLAQWSPDGEALLWTERNDDGSLTPKTWSEDEPTAYDTFVPSSVFAEAYLPFWDQYDRSISLWSADSGSFAMATATATGPEVVVHEIGGTSASYPNWDMAAWMPPTS